LTFPDFQRWIWIWVKNSLIVWFFKVTTPPQFCLSPLGKRCTRILRSSNCSWTMRYFVAMRKFLFFSIIFMLNDILNNRKSNILLPILSIFWTELCWLTYLHGVLRLHIFFGTFFLFFPSEKRENKFSGVAILPKKHCTQRIWKIFNDIVIINQSTKNISVNLKLRLVAT